MTTEFLRKFSINNLATPKTELLILIITMLITK